MKALVKTKAEAGLQMMEVPKPQPGHNDVLIKVKSTAICGTDIHIYNWDEWAQQHVPMPLVIGHEFVGEVVEVGQEVTGIKVGDRVAGEGHIACGFCRNCRAGRRHVCRKNESVGVTRPGCFAEYISIPAINAYPIPASIPNRIAAILDPLGNATHTALSYDLIGEDVLITGAGPVGIMAAIIARHVGARYVIITDVNAYRLELAKKIGVSVALDSNKNSLADAMKTLKMREGYDVGLEMSGNPNALREMLKYMVHNGKVALLGFLPRETQIDWNDVIMKGLYVKGIYGREMFETWYKMINMLQSGMDVSAVVTHEFGIDEYEKAFSTAISGQSGKVIMHF